MTKEEYDQWLKDRRSIRHVIVESAEEWDELVDEQKSWSDRVTIPDTGWPVFVVYTITEWRTYRVVDLLQQLVLALKG